MFFRDVKHQDRALSLLRRALASGRTHHAYLFDGPSGVGKELAGVALAARLMCLSAKADEFEPCGKCDSCRAMAAGTHPDFHLVERRLHKLHPDPQERRKKGLELGVNVVRHFLIEHASSSPSLGRRRVFVVRDAERMNEQAQNALLKTLEEPPGAACLILVTSSAARLLTTIRSRSQRIAFGLLPADFVRERVAAIANVSPNAAAALAALSDGRLGVALQWQRIDLLSAIEPLTRLLATTLDDIERFAKETLAVATDLAVRARKVTAAETAAPAERGAPPGAKPASKAAANDIGADADADDEDDDTEADADEESAKSASTDELRDAVRLTLMLHATALRDALVQREQLTQARILGDAPAVARLAERFDAAALGEAIRNIAVAETMIERSVQPQLALERLAAAMTGAAGVL